MTAVVRYLINKQMCDIFCHNNVLARKEALSSCHTEKASRNGKKFNFVFIDLDFPTIDK